MQEIYKGALPNDKTGTPARQAAQIINDNFKYLDAKISHKDGIVESTGWVESGQDKIMNVYWKWIIDAIDYTNPAAVTLNFPYSSTGKMRLDLVALTTSNTAIRIAGPESVSDPMTPPLPVNMVHAGFVLVTDSEVGVVTPPVVGDAYVKKMESQDFIANYGTTTVIDHVDLIDDRSSISLVGSATDVKSAQASASFIRPGKPHFFKNRTGHDVKLWHLAGTGNIKYFFPNGSDFIVKSGEVIEFNINANDSTAIRFEYVGKLITDNVAAIALKMDWILGINSITGITYALGVNDYKTIGVFSNANPIAFTVPTNAVEAVPIGVTFRYTVQGAGTVTIGGAGITFIQNNLVFITGTSFEIKKVAINTWSVDGSTVIPGARKPNVLYLSASGNDSTALPTDSSKPFLTLNACTTWLAAQSHSGLNWYIEVLDNGTYVQTNTFTLQGFNIINNNGGTIKIQNSFSITKQWIFDMFNGNLVFETIVGSVLRSNSYKDTATTYIDHFVNNVTFNDAQNLFSPANDRGWFRSCIGQDGFFNWQNTTNNSKTCFGNQIFSNAAIMNFGVVTNNATNIYGVDFFNTNQAESIHKSFLSIESYINNTASTQIITIRNSGRVGGITSTSANTILAFNELILDKNVTYNNTRINGHDTTIVGASAVPVSPKLLGNGFTITFNNTIGTDLINQGRSRPFVATYISNTILLQNGNISIAAGSSIVRIIQSDLRAGEYGVQLVLDNFVISSSTAGVVLMKIVNLPGVTAAGLYQIIFKNSVRLMNNTYMIQADANSAQPANLIVKENASIFHDFGAISSNANIQTTIPSNNTY
ncbi:hypothetical protein [Flavobacterium aestivum]|uniref:hypothetical protein n=1 Tax=Flavobacterium aestivum TaxID=3003257 RepID=UPI0024831217|nr:hypothetical protein [Flavobacterium aestivum]